MRKILVIIFLIIAITGVHAFAQEAGKIMSIMGSKGGTVQLLANDKAESGKILKEDDVIQFGDVLITKDCMVKIILTYYTDDPLVVIKPDTKIRLEKKKKYKKGGIFAFFGKLFFKGNGEDHRGFKIITSNAIAGIEGTEFEVEYNKIKKETIVTVFHGKVEVKLRKVIPGITKGNTRRMFYAGDTARIIGYGGFSSYTKKDAKMNIKKEEVEEVVEEELVDGDYETNGNLNIRVRLISTSDQSTSEYPVQGPAEILFENCKLLNGKPLRLQKNGSIDLDKLEHGATYNISVRLTRRTYNFDIDIDRSRKEEKIMYNIYYLNVIPPKLGLISNPDIIIKDLTGKMDGITTEFSFRIFKGASPEVLYYDNFFRGMQLKFYLPDRDDFEPIVLDFEYTGKLDLKDKKKKITIDGSKSIYEYKLK